MAVGVRLLSTRQLHGDAFTGVFPGGAYGLLVLNEQKRDLAHVLGEHSCRPHLDFDFGGTAMTTLERPPVPEPPA
ncbi:MAG: hypothetical protein JWQ31_3041, partial [Mycobacterium sp.]|nr:hypothetical protein [Mycobacterium sp.]